MIATRDAVGMKIYEWKWGPYTVSTDRCRIDIGTVHRFLAEESYWAKGRALSVIERSVENSLCFGLYDGQNNQVGFARAITDFATYGYLADVFVLRPHRGQGLGKWLVNCVLDHPELHGLYAWGLRTLDAHGLYARYGFASLTRPDMMMELRPEPRLT